MVLDSNGSQHVLNCRKIQDILNSLNVKGDGSPLEATRTTTTSNDPQPASTNNSSRKRTRKTQAYRPKARSGAYAILLALYRHAPTTEFMNKGEIIGIS